MVDVLLIAVLLAAALAAGAWWFARLRATFQAESSPQMAEADSDDDRALFEKAFARDVKQHVDAIASKYIRPGEGTYEFALMYLPAEGVYYELMCGKTGALLKYAHDQRVFPVSPTTFTA